MDIRDVKKIVEHSPTGALGDVTIFGPTQLRIKGENIIVILSVNPSETNQFIFDAIFHHGGRTYIHSCPNGEVWFYEAPCEGFWSRSITPDEISFEEFLRQLPDSIAKCIAKHTKEKS